MRALLVLALLLVAGVARFASASVSSPSGVTASAASSSTVQLGWLPVSGATGYRVSRGTGGTGPWTLAGSPGGTSFTDVGRRPATTYWYSVETVSAAGTSGRSTPVAVVTRPAAPSGLAASGTSSTAVHLGWPASPGATGYEIVRAGPAGTGAAVIGTSVAPGYEDTRGDPGTAYRYSVQAVGPSGPSTRSSAAAAGTATAAGAPAPPGALTARGLSATTVGLRWSPTPGATGYDVLRAATAAGPFTRVRRQAGTAWTDTGRPVGALGTYVVRAVGAAGTSGTSAAVGATTATSSGAPVSPGAPVAVVASPTKVALSWPAVAGAGGYRVLRASAPGGTYVPVGSPTGTTWADARLSPGSSSTWVVRAVGTRGTSGTSVAVAATTPAGLPPVAPTGLQARATSSDTVALSWAPVAGAEAYVLTRGPTGTDLPPQATTSAEDHGLLPLTTYSYTVRARSATGDSPPSAAVQVGTPETARPPDGVPPDAATGLSWTATGSSVTLAWTPPTDVDLATTTVRRATGDVPPSTPGDGDGVAVVAAGTATLVDRGLLPSTTYSYALFPRDTSGNTATGAGTTARTGPPEVVPVSGTLPASSTWSPERASVYHLTGDVTVPPGEVLTLAPGTVVAAAPGVALHVQGGLRTGAAGPPVLLTSDRDPQSTLGDGSPAASPGDWAGLDARPGAGSAPVLELHGVHLAYAATGVTADHASVTVTGGVLERLSGDGLDLRSPVGTPVVRDNRVERAAGTAVGLTGAALDLAQLDGNSGSGNGVDGVVLSASTLATDGSLPWSGDLPPVLGPACRALTVPAGRTLTLGPGSVVKSMSPQCGYLSVAGTLTAQGSEQDPVVLTSWRDDTAGGDTNGDAAATAPAPGDWKGVLAAPLSAPTLSLDDPYVEVRYASPSPAVEPRLPALPGWGLVANDSFATPEDLAQLRVYESTARVNGGLLPSDTANDRLQKPTVAGNVQLSSDPEAQDGAALSVFTRPAAYPLPDGSTTTGWANGRVDLPTAYDLPVMFRARLRWPDPSAQTKTSVMAWPEATVVGGRTIAWPWEVDFPETFGASSGPWSDHRVVGVRLHKDQDGDGLATEQRMLDVPVDGQRYHVYDTYLTRTAVVHVVDGVEVYRNEAPRWVPGTGTVPGDSTRARFAIGKAMEGVRDDPTRTPDELRVDYVQTFRPTGTP